MANKYIPAFLIVIALLAFPLSSSVHALSYSGSLNASEGSLVGYGGWSNSEPGSKYLSWTVDNNNNGDFWTYDYTWHAANKDISHIIIEVSDNFQIDDDIINWSAEEDTANDSPEVQDINNIDNQFDLTPQFNESIYGIKWDLHEDENTNDLKLTFNSTRSPMWGDFFAKDGKGDDYENSTYAFNAGFGSDPGDAWRLLTRQARLMQAYRTALTSFCLDKTGVGA